jgi:tetratricopeptide (TPR) repeat protein
MPLLVLTTHRPGYTVRWAGKTYYTQIALDALTEAETESMVAALLNRHDLPTDLLRFIQAKAGGNPLFIEEIVRSLGGRGLLVRHHDGLHWASDATVEFPTTMQDIMQARIDQLEQPVKRTAQTAAAIGREFGLRLLSQVSEMADELPHHLGILKNAELIHERRFFPELEYRFKHAVIHDVAYQSLLVQRRKVLHGAIGQAIEQLYADRLEEQAAMLAYHYALSERQDKAARYTLLAGDQAARLYANAEATTHYTQALSLARSLPPSPEAQRMQIDATLKLASVGGTRQDLERDLSNLEPAQRLAEALNDAPRLAQVLYWLGRLHYVMWNSPPAIAYARQSLEIADRLGDTTLAAPAVNLLGRLYWQRSDFLQASQMLERSVEQMRQLGNTNEEATAASFAGLVLGSLGQFEQAFSYADHGLRLAQQIHNPLAEAAAYQYRGTIHDQRGEWAQAIAAYQEARRVAERAGDRFRVYLVQFWEGRAHAQAGDPDRGRMLLEESIALAQQIGTNFGLAYQKTFLATCLLALGELDMACRLCHEAIQVAERTDDQRVSAFVHQTLAQALFHLTPADRQPAEHAMLEAIRTSQEIGAQPELARSYLRYARLLQSWGEAAKTREYLTEAIGMFQRMGMGWDVAQAEEVLHMLPKFAPS